MSSVKIATLWFYANLTCRSSTGEDNVEVEGKNLKNREVNCSIAQQSFIYVEW